MSVSLKKPSVDVHKVDLSKSDLPKKLPECTPVHLIDEEETIKSRPLCIRPFVSTVNNIRFHHSEEEDEHIWDLYEKAVRREKIKRILVVCTSVVIIIGVFFLIAFLIFDSFSPGLFSEVLSGSFSVFQNVLDYLSDNWLFNLLFVVLCFSFLFHFVRIFSRFK